MTPALDRRGVEPIATIIADTHKLSRLAESDEGTSAMQEPGESGVVPERQDVCSHLVWAESARPRFEDGRFSNPVLPGDYPDPSVIRDGDVYYLVASSFIYYPGLVIWTSTNLVDWTPIGPALIDIVGSVYAPELVMYEGRYYIYFAVRAVPDFPVPTELTKELAPLTTYVVYADSIEGPWSDPIDVGISDQIDPGHAVGEDGRRYLYVSDGVLSPLSIDGLRRAAPEEKVYEGWRYPADWEVESFSLEGPKIVRRDGWFYMFSSEGGTAGPPTSHMVIVARSRSIRGPWENAPENPLVRTKAASDTWWSRGHGTPVEDAAGRWWLVQHGYENGRRSLGRQALIEPIEWPVGGWPRAIGGDPSAPLQRPSRASEEGSVVYQSDGSLEIGPLGARFSFFKPRAGYLDRIRFEAGSVILYAQGEAISESSPLVFNAADRDYEVSVDLELESDVVAGLILFYNEAFFCGVSFDGDRVRGYLAGREVPEAHSGQLSGRTVKLRVVNIGQVASFFSSLDGVEWTLHHSFEVGGYNHNVAGKYLSLRPAVFVTGDGEARISSFHYRGLTEEAV